MRLTRFVAGLALTAGALASAASAVADPYGVGGSNAGLRPDNSEHTYCFTGDFTSNNGREAANTQMGRLDNETTMIDNKVPDCNTATDARFVASNLGNADGSWSCQATSGNKCLASTLRFDEGNITSYDDWRQTTCHEIGHSVGLSHGDGSDCMGTNQNNQGYDDHNVNHINNDRS